MTAFSPLARKFNINFGVLVRPVSASVRLKCIIQSFKGLLKALKAVREGLKNLNETLKAGLILRWFEAITGVQAMARGKEEGGPDEGG